MVLLFPEGWITCAQGKLTTTWDCFPWRSATIFALGWSLGTWISREVPTFLTEKCGHYAYTVCANGVVLCQTSGNAFLLGIWNFTLSWGAWWLKSGKILCGESIIGFAGQKPCACTAVFLLLREQQALCDTLWERDSVRKSASASSCVFLLYWFYHISICCYGLTANTIITPWWYEFLQWITGCGVEARQ